MVVKNIFHLSKISQQVAKTLINKKLTLSVCESCTGGMMGSVITSIPGSSKYFLGGIIAYSNKIKQKIIGIKPQILKKHGAVSAKVASEMALGIRKKLKSDIGIGITGIAGPSGGTKKKPAGLVYIAVSLKRILIIKRFLFKGGRETIRKRACKEALFLLNHNI